MNTLDTLKKIHQRLEEAIAYEDLETISDATLDLELLIRDYESQSSFDYHDEY